jgi:plastocyanin
MVLRPPRALAVALVAAGLAAAPAAQGTATLHGRVELRSAPRSELRPDIGELGAPRPRPPERRPSVVYLESAPRAAFEATPDRRVRMDQRNETFVPHVLAITAGTVVDFPNNDPTYHNVFSLSRTKPFDLGRYAAGRSKSVLFDRPGIVRVFCDIHSHMNAWILVFAHRFFSMTNDDGRYRIEGIPPGTYMVSVWNEAATLESRSVSIPAGVAAVEANFTLSREKAPK